MSPSNKFKKARGIFKENDLVLPESGLSYLERVELAPGLITTNSICYKAFTKRGWYWASSDGKVTLTERIINILKSNFPSILS